MKIITRTAIDRIGTLEIEYEKLTERRKEIRREQKALIADLRKYLNEGEPHANTNQTTPLRTDGEGDRAN